MSQEENIIKLIDENGDEKEFEVLATFDVEEDEYAALLPLGDEEEEVYLLKMIYDEDGELMLLNIEDEEEFTDVVAAYEAIVDEII